MQSFTRKTNQIFEHPAVAIFFILFFPLLIEFTYSDFVRGSELNSRVGWFILILSLVWLLRKKLFPFLLLGVFIVSGCMDGLYATTFGGVFTTASFEAMALTDSQEAVGFLQTYASFENISLLGFYMTGSLYFLYNAKISPEKSPSEKFIIGLGIIMFGVATYRLGVLHKYYDTIPGFAGTLPSYYAGHGNVAKKIEARKSFVKNSPVIATLNQKDQQQTYLIIIGESLSRKHMGLYGYHRNTTPEFSMLSNESPDELMVQTNTISTHVQTQPSLRHTLTQVDTGNKLSVAKALSMIDIANKAGFKTWWISNQQPLRSTISAIAHMADETQYISNDYHGVQVRRFDGLMQPYVEKALNDDATHKIIFVHLMGSHLQYKNRYPEEFAKFTDNNVKGYEENLSSSKIEYINSYDNSVLYTDFVVANMIKSLKTASKNKNQIAAALFLADHGEEIFDSKNFVGHGPDTLTPTMVEIPFVVWTSEQYRQFRPAHISAMKENINEAASLDNTFHFISHLAGIESDIINKNNSLSSETYTSRKRMVYKSDYDLKIKNRPSK